MTLSAYDESVIHAFRIDGLQERQARAGREQLTTDQKLKFMRTLRAEWAKSLRPQAVQMATAILADIERVAKFTRGKR